MLWFSACVTQLWVVFYAEVPGDTHRIIWPNELKATERARMIKDTRKRLDCVAEKVACDDLQRPELAVNLLHR